MLVQPHRSLALAPAHPPTDPHGPYQFNPAEAQTQHPLYTYSQIPIALGTGSDLQKPNPSTNIPHLSDQSQASCPQTSTCPPPSRSQCGRLASSGSGWQEAEHQDWACMEALWPLRLSHCWQVPRPWALGMLQGFFWPTGTVCYSVLHCRVWGGH